MAPKSGRWLLLSSGDRCSSKDRKFVKASVNIDVYLMEEIHMDVAIKFYTLIVNFLRLLLSLYNTYLEYKKRNESKQKQ